MDIRYLTTDEILRLHALEVGGHVGVRDLNLVEAAAERPRQSAFGDDAYPDLASKAAALFDSLVRNHPFVDGNKRIGVLASFVFAELNGFEIDTTNNEVVDTVLALIVREIDFDELVGRFQLWMNRRISTELSGPVI